MIILVIKLFTYNAEARKESNGTLRLIAAILAIFTLINYWTYCGNCLSK